MRRVSKLCGPLNDKRRPNQADAPSPTITLRVCTPVAAWGLAPLASKPTIPPTTQMPAKSPINRARVAARTAIIRTSCPPKERKPRRSSVPPSDTLQMAQTSTEVISR